MAGQEELLRFIVDSDNIDEVEEASALDDDFDEDDLTLPSEGDDVDASELPEEGSNNETASALSAALVPGQPLYLVQRSPQHSAVLPEVMRDLANDHHRAMSLGVVAPMPRMSPTSVRRFFDAAGMPAIRIADPECFARADSLGPVLEAQREKPYVGISKQQHWPYFTASHPSGLDASWIKQVIDAQHGVGATIMLTPGMWVDPAAPSAGLALMRQHAAWARAYLGSGAPLVVNVTLSPSWLTSTDLRDQLLNEIVDMDENTFYIRIRWPLLGHPYGQLLDAAILDGYAEVANVFEENEKALILPNTGMTGMIALAWGGHGFSTGIGSGERAFAETRVIRIKRTPRPVPTRRILAAQIMHTTDVTTAGLLDAAPRGERCSCVFCERLRRLPPGQFDKGLAGAHYLRKVGDFTAHIAADGRGRRSAARGLVRSASQFAKDASATVVLDGANSPQHLGLWSQRLR